MRWAVVPAAMALSDVVATGSALRSGSHKDEAALMDPSVLLARWGLGEGDAFAETLELRTVRDVLYRGYCVVKCYRRWKHNMAAREKRRERQRDAVLKLIAGGVEGDVR